MADPDIEKIARETADPTRGYSIVTISGRILGRIVAFLVTEAGLGKVPPSPPHANRIWYWIEQVEQMRFEVNDDWNGYGSEAPNSSARELAKAVLLSSNGIVTPDRVVPSAQGGVGICFYKGTRYADVECLNTGEVLATISDGSGNPEVWEVAE